MVLSSAADRVECPIVQTVGQLVSEEEAATESFTIPASIAARLALSTDDPNSVEANIKLQLSACRPLKYYVNTGAPCLPLRSSPSDISQIETLKIHFTFKTTSVCEQRLPHNTN